MAGLGARAVTRGVLLGLTAVLAGSVATAAGDKTEDAKKACSTRHEQSQVLRRNNKLAEARTALLACAQDICPGGIRSDCVEWLGAVTNAIPSVVVTAKLRDKDEYNVRLTIDDDVVASRLDGVAIELNPGVHTFKLELAGQDPVEQQVLLVEGQKNRVVAVRFGKPEPEAAAGGAAKSPDLYRPVPTLTYVLGGVAIAGLGAFAGFGAWGLSQKKSLEDSCAPLCSPSETDSVKTKFLIADISLGVAVASTVVGAVIFFSRPGYERSPVTGARSSAARPAANLMIVPTKSGALVGLEGAL